MIVVIRNFDGNPPPQGASEPMRVSLVCRLISRDGSEYWLALPSADFAYETADGRTLQVSNVIVSPGSLGQSFAPAFEGRVNVAYVTDSSLLTDAVLDFKKCDYVAHGDGYVLPEHAA
jgi:hypothetical protein